MWYRTLSPMYSLILFRISFPVSYHPPSMLSWSISYQSFVQMSWRQIFSSVSHLCVYLWLCRSSHGMLTQSDIDHSCTIYHSGFGVALCGSSTSGSLQVTHWRIILGLITQVLFGGIHAGKLTEFISNVRHLYVSEWSGADNYAISMSSGFIL